MERAGRTDGDGEAEGGDWEDRGDWEDGEVTQKGWQVWWGLERERQDDWD